MRAIDYGLQYYGGFSYKNTKTNICVFNDSKIIDDDTNEINSQDDSIVEIVYKEVEYEDDGNKSVLFIPNGEIISFETFEYLKQSGTTTIEEFKIRVETNQYNDDVLQLTERIIYKIDNKFYAKIDGANFTLNDVEVTVQSKKAKQNIPLFLLNNELYNKKVSVVVFISDDGAALERAYQSIECFNNEVVIFVENNKGANLFGSVLRVKLGSNISDLTGFPSHQVAKIINAFRLEVAIDTKIISQVIQEEINNNSGLLHFIKKRWLLADKVVTVSTEYVFDLLAETIEELFSKKLENAKFNDNRWQYYTSDGSINKDANLLFFNPAVFDDLDDKAKSKLTKSIFKSAQEELSQHEHYFNILWNQAKGNEKLKFYYKVIYKGVKKINSLFSILNDFLKTQSSIIINFTKELGIALNAFLVGLLNGIIEVIKGFFDIVALLCKGVSAVQFEAKNITSYIGIFIESIENFIDGIINLFTKENLNAILNFTIDIFSFITVLPQKIINFFTDTDFTTTIDRVAYYIGYIIGMIIDVIVGVITTGGAKTVADVVKIVAKQFTDLLKLGKQAIDKSVKLAANFLDNIIAIFAKLRNGAKNIKPFLDEILEFLRKLFDDLGKKIKNDKGGAYGNSVVATRDPEKVKKFLEDLKKLSSIKIIKPLNHIKEVIPYFNHKALGEVVVSMGRTNCGNTVEVVVEFLKTGKIKLAEPSAMQGLNEVAAKFGGGSFQPSTIPRMKELIKDGDIIVIYGIKQKNKITGSTVGHYFVGIKDKDLLHLIDGQTGEQVIFAQSTEYADFIKRGYLEFKYLKVK